MNYIIVITILISSLLINGIIKQLKLLYKNKNKLKKIKEAKSW